MEKLFKFNVILVVALLASNWLLATDLTLELIDSKKVSLPGEKEPQNTVFMGEPFRLKVTIKNADKNTGDAKLDAVEKLQILGKSSSSNIMMINGRFSAEKSYFYDVCTENDGTFEIGPAQVQQNGSTIRSNTVKFRSIQRPENFKENSNDSNSSEENFVECELLPDKKSVFVGEPLTVSLKIIFGTNVRIYDNGRDMLQFDGFQEKDSYGKFDQREEVKNGKAYTILEKKYYLVPLQTGLHKIGPAKIVYQIPDTQRGKARGIFNDDFFNFGGLFDQARFVKKQLFSKSLSIQVMSASQNQNDIDGVGRFSVFKSSVDKNTALLNEAIKLTLEIEGEGNIEQITTPKLKLDPFIKSYESKADFIEDPSHKPFLGKKIFEFIIQVGKAGEITIPAQKFLYLDTDTKQVKSIETKPITLQINQPIGEQTQDEKAKPLHVDYQTVNEEKSQQIQPQAQEISFIEQEGPIIQKEHWSMPWWLIFLLLLLPIPFFTRTIDKIISKLKLNKTFLRASKKSALNRFVNEFEKIQKEQRPDQLYSFFLSFLAVRFDLFLQEISHEKVLKKLYEYGLEENKINEFMDFLNDCASLHFITNQKSLSARASDELFKKGKYWIIMLTK